MLKQLQEIGDKFRLPGKVESYDIIKNGNINSTYKVNYEEPGKSYIFQKINTYVFKNPVEIMKSIDEVTSHIRAKHRHRVTLHFHHTAAGLNFYQDESEGFWRVMNYIESVTFNTCDNPTIVRYTGEAFGDFQLDLSDFDASCLFETIPDFHNTRKRLENLFQDADLDLVGRVQEVQEELAYIRAMAEKACELCDRYYAHEFPIRVAHNDTKSNNVLYDIKTYRPLVVIDLDTVMPGMAMYDFGDAVRFMCNTAAEDEENLSKVSFNANKFRAFCEGYIGKVKDSLTRSELDSMVLGAFSITIELAARFLDDYISGDVYFKVLYPKHNLVRTRCQLHLARDIMRQYPELCRIVSEML